MKKSDKIKKEKKIIISEEVDGAVGGAAVGMAFVVVALFVTFNKDYLNNEVATTIIRWVFLLLGTPIALACTLHKAKCDSNRLAHGFFISGLWFLLYSYFDALWIRLPGLLLLFLGAFLILQELFFIVQSLAKRPHPKETNAKAETEKLGKADSLFAFVATILGLVLAAVQILQQLDLI